jgi:hypothetical protein
MGGGIARTVRLLGVDLRKQVHEKGGTDEDIELVRERRPKLFESFAEAIVKTARALKIADGKFTTWKTIRLGVHQNVKALKRALEVGGNRISNYDTDLMCQSAFSFAKKPEDAELVRVTVRELGFDKGTSLREILARGTELGLKICEPEIGPGLRLNYSDQPSDEVLWIAMNPMSGSGGHPEVFYVYRGVDARWLNTRWLDLDSLWYPEIEFVFRK